jgi:alkanesulfonate monooxygenase SsuD/methylene tetrahydromethanopterin reductase-like flavin-dependent oxidoreductase (luciferase family)
MHIGLVMECDYRVGATQEEAFDEALRQAEFAERLGLDSVWLAERHFASPNRQLDALGTGIPSVASAPLIWVSAIAARTTQLRVGTGVSVLPLCHPIRLAEEAATVDQLSKGRLEFGVGRSSFATAYQGYAIPYTESRGRFQEALDVLVQAWTQDHVSYQGQYFTFDNVCVLPKPYQKPHPPIRIAATTQETFPQVGRMGYPALIGLRGFDSTEAARHLQAYRAAWHEAGHAGRSDVFLRLPIYVAETAERALSEPHESTMRSYRRMAGTFGRSVGTTGTTASEERQERSERLSRITYDELLAGRLAYGTPDMVADRLAHLRDTLRLTGVLMEPNVGGYNPPERVLNSIRLFAQEVAPQLRQGS